jgi:hypothetical protein
MIGGIWLYERRQDEAMRRSRVRLGLRFPIGLEPVRAYAALDGLSGLTYANELIAEVTACEGRIAHFLWVPRAARASVASTMTGVIPSLRIADADTIPTDGVTLALRLFVPSPSVLSGENATEASRSLLAGLAVLRPGEDVAIRWALRPGRTRHWQAASDASPRQREIERAWRRKTTQAGFKVAGLVLIRAQRIGRARELAGHIESVIRSRRALTGDIRMTAGRGNRSFASLPHVTRTSGWLSSGELLALLGWPLGPDVPMGVEVGATRELLVARHVPRSGRRLFMGHDTSGERWVALDPPAARLHTVVAGSSGSGKSELLARGILDEIAGGHSGGAVIDPKADLIQTILEHVPSQHADRVVVLDPGDDSRPTPGVDVLRGGDPDLRTDVLIGALKNIFSDWGIRSETYGRLAIRSLCDMPGATLADAGRLFSSEPFLRAVIARLRDPYLIEAWKQYLALPAGSRLEHIQAPMARVTALLARPRVRAVLANPEPKLDVARLFAERKWLLVSLAPGTLGEAGANIVGAALTHMVWSAIEARAALAPARRHLISIYLDELATLTGGVPFSFELLAERARGLGAGLTVAVQTLGRIPEPTRSALLGNSGSFVTFRAPAEEATRIARQLPGLTDADVMALERFHVAARLTAGGAVSVVTGRTLALPAPTGHAASIRDASARLYGTPVGQPDLPATSSQASTHEAETQTPGRTRRAS